MQNNKKGTVDKIWDFFASIKLAIFVFTAIGITSIVGTIIEQNAEPEKNIRLLSKMFGSSYASDIYRLVDAIGLNNMYHSWWFIALLFLFVSNLLICSLERLPSIIKILKEPQKPIEQENFEGLPIRHKLTMKQDLQGAVQRLSSVMQKAGFKFYEHREGDLVQLYAEAGRYSRFGVYITHLSILLLFIGVVIGIFMGFNGYLNLLEGTSSSVAYLANGKEINLGFDIRCDDFEVSFYEGTDTPKAYRSVLVVLEQGKEILRKDIEVNTPLRYKGITFYQSSFGFAPSPQSLFHFRIASKSNKIQEIKIPFDETFIIPDTKVKVKISDFTPALGVDESGKLFTYADSMYNPAVLLEFHEGNRVINRQWVIKRYPHTWVFPEGTIEFVDLWGSQYTGLQVRKDPGVWIVYVACLIMSVGLYMSFFMSHRRLWILLRSTGKETEVMIGGWSNKYRASLAAKIQGMVDSITSK